MPSRECKESMTCEEQLDEWVKGNSIHNETRDECCPDFSCCQPHLLASIEERIAFKNASESVRSQMLMMFLGAAFQSKKVYFSGDGEAGNA